MKKIPNSKIWILNFKTLNDKLPFNHQVKRSAKNVRKIYLFQ